MIRSTLTLAAALSLAAGAALAQDSQTAPMDHSQMAAAQAEAAPSTAGFKAAGDKMHNGMMIAFSGDADVDFVRSMIPHHQGAIDMAKVVLERGDDPEVRKMAEEIIAAQEAEIAEMQKWLEARDQ